MRGIGRRLFDSSIASGNLEGFDLELGNYYRIRISMIDIKEREKKRIERKTYA